MSDMFIGKFCRINIENRSSRFLFFGCEEVNALTKKILVGYYPFTIQRFVQFLFVLEASNVCTEKAYFRKDLNWKIKNQIITGN